MLLARLRKSPIFYVGPPQLSSNNNAYAEVILRIPRRFSIYPLSIHPGIAAHEAPCIRDIPARVNDGAICVAASRPNLVRNAGKSGGRVPPAFKDRVLQEADSLRGRPRSSTHRRFRIPQIMTLQTSDGDMALASAYFRLKSGMAANSIYPTRDARP